MSASLSERFPSPLSVRPQRSSVRLADSTVDTQTHDDLADRRDVETFLRRNR